MPLAIKKQDIISTKEFGDWWIECKMKNVLKKLRNIFLAGAIPFLAGCSNNYPFFCFERANGQIHEDIETVVCRTEDLVVDKETINHGISNYNIGSTVKASFSLSEKIFAGTWDLGTGTIRLPAKTLFDVDIAPVYEPDPDYNSKDHHLEELLWAWVVIPGKAAHAGIREGYGCLVKGRRAWIQKKYFTSILQYGVSDISGVLEAVKSVSSSSWYYTKATANAIEKSAEPFIPQGPEPLRSALDDWTLRMPEKMSTWYDYFEGGFEKGAEQTKDLFNQ